MQVTIADAGNTQHIAIVRADGSRAETQFPRKGPFPHDAVHYAVETELSLRHGFWGLIAGGRHPDEISEIARAAGHASAKRAQLPEPHIVELIQAERLVECFEAEIWGGSSDFDTFRTTAKAACDSSLVPVPPLDNEKIAAVRAQLAAMARGWTDGRLSFEWDESAGG